jgi:molybdate/tungstate transport system substrate-binding protein
MMYGTQMPDNRGPYAEWNIVFARNRLGIAYTPHSLYGQEININNWYEVLARPDVKFGLSDPRFDSLGYRVLMALQLAQLYYKDNTIFQTLIGDNFAHAFNVEQIDKTYRISVPEITRPANKRILMRAYSIQTLALLQSNEIDYAFEYESVARQYGLEFLQLPPEIDLSSDTLDEYYHQVSVKLDFQRFASITPEFVGEAILYGITIPRNSPHPYEAVKFIAFILGSEGRQILTDYFQPCIVPAVADNKANIPTELIPLVK